MYKVTTQPTFEPITLADAKDWLKVHPDVVDDDNLIRALIASARSWAEKGTGGNRLCECNGRECDL